MTQPEMNQSSTADSAGSTPPSLRPPKGLRDFQMSLGQYLRSPETQTLPEGVDARRAQVYEDLLIRNIRGFLGNCFPVCKTLIDEAAWLALTRRFFRDWRSESPFFKDIPAEFLAFLQNSNALETLPDWFYELAHYEWVELYIETAKTYKTDETNKTTADENKIYLQHPLLALSYQWPVHKICADFIPQNPHPSYLLVYRNPQNSVKFNEISPATFVLIQTLQQGALSRNELYEQLSENLQTANTPDFRNFCSDTLRLLIEQAVIVESQKHGSTT